MKKTRYQACLLISELDDDMILEAELANVPVRAGKYRSRYGMKRILVIAACIAMLAVIAVSMLLPAMLSDAEVTTDPSDTQAPPVFDAEWVEDPTIVQVQRLSSIRQSFVDRSDSITSDPYMTSTVAVAESPGQRLILIRFNCREDEQIVVTPSQDCAVSVAIQKEGANDRPVWYRIDPMDGSETYARELVTSRSSSKYPHGETVLLGKSLTVSGTDALLWQYSDEGVSCVQDNFVDFTVINEDGQITGAGSVYVGGLDLIPLTENKTYYDGSDARFNTIYRASILGAYRCDSAMVERSDIAELLDELHQKAEEVRAEMFKDLSADSFKFSIRKLKQEQSESFIVKEEDGSMEMFMSMVSYRGDDRYAIVMNHDGSKNFFLYNGIYQMIQETEIDAAAEHGAMLKGRYILADGTIVRVDFLGEPLFTIHLPAM